MTHPLQSAREAVEKAEKETAAGCKQSIPEARRKVNAFNERLPLRDESTPLDWERAVTDEKIGFLEDRIMAERFAHRNLIAEYDKRIADLLAVAEAAKEYLEALESMSKFASRLDLKAGSNFDWGATVDKKRNRLDAALKKLEEGV